MNASCKYLFSLMVLFSGVFPAQSQDLSETAHTYLMGEAEAGFSGSVLLVNDGLVVLKEGYGMADRQNQIANTGDTVYPIGSIVKLFTRDAIRVLEEQGHLSGDDTLARFFPDVPTDKAGITVEQLLSHQSGFNAYHGEDFEPLDRSQALERIFSLELLFVPGTDRSYSNSGYSVLAAIVEVLSGETFPDFVMEHLVIPAGLTQTGFYGFAGWNTNDVAIGYEGETHGAVNSPAYWKTPSWGLMGGGGMGSSVAELHRWMSWRQERFNQKMPPSTPYDPEAGSRTDQAMMFAAGGGNWGYYAAYVALDENTLIVVFSNADDDGVEDLIILESLANILSGEEPVVRKVPQLQSSDRLPDSVAGQRMAGFINAVNANDETATRMFVSENMDRGFQQNTDRLLGFFDAVRDELGPDAQIDSFLQPDQWVINAFIQNRLDKKWYVVYLEVDETPPHPISGIRTDEAEDPHSLTPENDTCGDRRLPPNPVGEAAARLLDTICSADSSVHETFVTEMVAPAILDRVGLSGFVEMLQTLHNNIGDASVHAVELSSPIGGTFGIEAENGDHFEIELGVESDSPHRIVSFGVDMAGPAVQFGSLDAVEDFLQNESDSERFSGNVLVSHHGDVVFQQAYGFANKEAGLKNKLDTAFNIGSINKLFTGVAILQLAEKGLLGLDTPIGTYLTGLPDVVSKHVTVRHLLQHRSGWGDYFDADEYVNRRESLRTISDYLSFIRDLPLEFGPGTSQQYSNAGYEVLGAIIESVSGQSYYDYIDRYVYKPAGMTSSGSYRLNHPALALGYIQLDSEAYGTTNQRWLPPVGTAAGGGYSTLADLLAFQQSLFNDELLGRTYTHLLLNQFEESESSELQGGGGYAGGAPGVNSVWEFDLDTGYSVFILSNFDPPVAEELAPAILKMVLESENK